MAKKYFKKALSMGLALTMCLSLAAPAFAEDVPESEYPYRTEIDAAADARESAELVDNQFDNVNYGGVDSNLGDAAIKNESASNNADQVTQAVTDAEETVSDAVTEQQGLVEGVHETASKDINDAATTITGETEKVSAAVDEANKAVEGVNEKLEALKDETLTPEQKVEAAQEAQAAADAAVQAAADAAKVVETAQETVDAAVKAAEDAKAAYDAAVQAAQNAVGEAKEAALAKLEKAKETLKAAKEDLADATTAKKAADAAKEDANEAKRAADRALEEAKKAYNNIEWPESGIAKDAVDRDKIVEKLGDADTAQTNAEDAQVKVDKLTDAIEANTVQQGNLNDAKTLYENTVNNVKEQFEIAIAQAEANYQAAVSETEGTVVDGNGDWAKNQVALKAGVDENGNTLWKDWLFFDDAKTIRISNSNFAYYLAISKSMSGEGYKSYEELNEYYGKWIKELGDGSGNKNKYEKAAELCADIAKEYTNSVNGAAVERENGLTAATDKLRKDTELDNIAEVNKEIKRLTDQIERDIVDKKDQEGIVIEQKAVAIAAREAAQKLTDLLALKEALAAAKYALNQAQEAQAAAAERQFEAERKLAAYNDAQKAVEEAEEALKAKLSGDLESGKLSLTAGADFDADLAELEAKLKEAQDAAKEAEENYNKAKEDADKAKEDAENAKKDADEAKEDADRELEDFNDRYVGGDTGGADDADDAGDPDDTGVEIDDEAIPLSNGPVTRAQFVDYLWRHEGSPAAESELFADHEYAPAIAWALSVEIIGEDFQPDELATVADVRAILGSFAQVFGSNAVDAADLTTLAGEDGEAVMNCAQVLAEFFGEEYDIPEDLDNLEIDDAA